MTAEHLHHAGDGRGARRVYVDGRAIERAVCADTRRGVVLVHVGRRRGMKLVTRAVAGAIEVVPIRG